MSCLFKPHCSQSTEPTFHILSVCSFARPQRSLADDEWLILSPPPPVFYLKSHINVSPNQTLHKLPCRGYLRYDPSSSGNCFLAGFAIPDANGVTFHCDLAAECAGISSMLTDLHFFDLFTKRGTISVITCQLMQKLHEARKHIVPYLPVTPTSEENVN